VNIGKRLLIAFVLVSAGVLWTLARHNLPPPPQAQVRTDAAKREALQYAREDGTKSFSRSAVRKACKEHLEWDFGLCLKMDERQAVIGMDAEQLRLAWGTPEHINATVFANHRSEQWVYGGSQYVYLDDGVVRSMQQSR
jgi:hypothetical protein